MKKEFQKVLGSLSKVALTTGFFLGLLCNGVCFATEVNQTTEFQAEIPAHGRATLTVEDLQTLLGLKTRDPSSKGLYQQQDVADTAATFDIALSSKEKARIIASLRKLEIQRANFEKQLEEEKVAEINQIRNSRRQIQLSRTRANRNDAKLGRDLFDSLLQEANAKASVEDSLREFDNAHAIEIQFAVNTDGERLVGAIKLGSDMIWENSNSKRMIAKR